MTKARVYNALLIAAGINPYIYFFPGHSACPCNTCASTDCTSQLWAWKRWLLAFLQKTHCGWSWVTASYRLRNERLTSRRGLHFRTCALLSLPGGFCHTSTGDPGEGANFPCSHGKGQWPQTSTGSLKQTAVCFPLKQLVWAITCLHPLDMKTASKHLTASFPPSLFMVFCNVLSFCDWKCLKSTSLKTAELDPYYSQVWVSEWMNEWMTDG